MKKSTISDVVLAVTYRCNSRCRMCNIWQRKDNSGELTLADLANLPVSLKNINLSGGEPFLRMDLPQIVAVIKKRCPQAKIAISSNGFATEIILAKMKEIIGIDPQITVALSLDGIGQAHDEIRGIPGGFEKVLATLHGLRQLGVKNLRLAFTIGDYNIDQLKKVYELAQKEKVEMTLAAVHSSENYFGQKNKINAGEKIAAELEWLVKKEISSWNPKRWLRAYFTAGLKKFVLSGERLLPDYSGKLSCFIDPLGDVYPSDISAEKIGNLRSGLENLSAPDRKVCDQSWMICTARPAIKKHFYSVIFWIIGRKIINIFGK
jgi:MoaA/NifB/PqqE/SkfB family radical SAM enzyme